MAREDFVPRSDNDLMAKHDQFKIGMGMHGTTLGFTAPEIAAVTTDNTALHTTIPAAETAKAANQAATNTKNLAIVPAIGRWRAFAKRAKAAPTYTPTMGANMAIIGAEDSTDLHTSAPEVKGRDLGSGHAEIQFVKSISSGVNLYSKRGSETVFTYLAHDTQAPYIDTRPLLDPTKPELRVYRLKFVKGDEEVGNYSEELVVNCAP